MPSPVSPLDEATFARLMQAVGPFETQPRVAVAVSGGPDSMALCGLMDHWARQHGGQAVGLTVDHGLRPEAAEEARVVGKRLAAFGMIHHVLTRLGPPPQAGIQAMLRTARYQLLEGWCRGEGILHLALAHHQDDQVETVLLRLARGSGVQGLAAMAPVIYHHDVRLVRPLLNVARAYLQATCIALGLAWLDDPSNQNEAFARVRMRRLLSALATEGVDAVRLATTAGHLARAGVVVTEAVASLLARSARLHPFGFAWLNSTDLAVIPAEVALRSLACLLRVVGGHAYSPRLRRLEALHEAILARAVRGGRTLAGCLLRPHQGGLLLCRELSAVELPKEITAGMYLRWDGRFTILIPATIPSGLYIGALGQTGWREAVATHPTLHRLPGCIGHTLPALHRPDGHVQPIFPTGGISHQDTLEGKTTTTLVAIFAPDMPAIVRV